MSAPESRAQGAAEGAVQRPIEGLLRELAPQVLGAVIRRSGDFAAAEDAVQQALIAAAERWPSDGVPEDPRAWLVRVASRRVIDHVRAEAARRRREELVVSLVPAEDPLALAAGEDDGSDDSLVLLFLCCHPALSPASAIALTLRAVVALNHAIATAMVRGPAAGLERLDALARDARLAEHHRLDAVRGHLLERAGDREAAQRHYRRAAERTTSVPERDYLRMKAARLDGERRARGSSSGPASQRTRGIRPGRPDALTGGVARAHEPGGRAGRAG